MVTKIQIFVTCDDLLLEIPASMATMLGISALHSDDSIIRVHRLNKPLSLILQLPGVRRLPLQAIGVEGRIVTLTFGE